MCTSNRQTVEETIDYLKGSLFEKEILCYYTTFETALKILCSKSIRFSLPLKVNDINESSRVVVSENIDVLDTISQEIGEYRQISFSENGPYRKAFDIPAMWGHYADNGNGVCFAFDKEKLLSCMDCTYHRRNIRYMNADSRLIQAYDIVDIENNIERIFFEKTNDWSYEQEFRIVRHFSSHQNEIQYLNYPVDSLISLILCGSTCNDELIRKKKMMTEISKAPILFYDSMLLNDRYSLFWIDSNRVSHDILNNDLQTLDHDVIDMEINK